MKCLILFLALLPVFACDTQQEAPSAEQLIRGSYHSAATGQERDYFVYLPQGYEEGRDWPVVFFLHGGGERGNGKEDLDFVLKHGPLYEAWIQQRAMPFVIVAPQLPLFGRDTIDGYLINRTREDIPTRKVGVEQERPGDYRADRLLQGWKPETSSLDSLGLIDGWYRCVDDLNGILHEVTESYQVDGDRVYLTGISYGGFGTWYWASQNPEHFAAIAPVVGYGHPSLMQPIAETQLPVWQFIGGRDPAIEPKYFYDGLNKLERLGIEELRVTTHDDMGHLAWVRIYAGEDIYGWLLDHRRGQ